MATVMIGDQAVEAGADVFHLQHVNEKLRKLEYAGFKIVDAFVAWKQFRIVMADHGTTGAGRDHDIFRSLEGLQKMFRDGAGFIAIAAIERWLRATGLGLAKFHFAAGA